MTRTPRALALLLAGVSATAAPALPVTGVKCLPAAPGSQASVPLAPVDQAVDRPLEDIAPGQAVERDVVPSGADLINAILRGARQNCKPVGLKEAPPGKTTLKLGVQRDPTADETEGKGALLPTIGISRRF